MFAFYLFLLSGIALLVFYGSSGEAVNTLVKLLLGTGFASAERFASAFGTAVSAGLVWLLHWRAYRARLGQVGQSQHSLTLVYLFTLSLVFGLWAVFQGASVVELAMGAVMGLDASSAWELAGQAAKLVLTVALWVEHMRLLSRENERAAANAGAAAQA